MNIDREKIIQTQKDLSNLIGCPGHEEEVTDYILTRLEECSVDKAWVDPLGNVLATKAGGREDGLKILLDAHVDEVGFMIFVDIGCSNIDEVRKYGLDVGSVGTFYTEFKQINENVLIGKAFDDRTACNVLLQVLLLCANENVPNTILANFAVQEEVGGRGATVGAYSLDPDIALALENTIASDMPGVPPHKVVTKLGAGPAVTAADRSLITPKIILERIKQAAEIDNIPWQYKKPIYGGSDGGRIAISKSGVPTSVVSVPCRYIHSNVALLHLDDIINTIKLVRNFCKI